MKQMCARVAESKGFHRTIIIVILTAAVLVGLETSPALMAQYGETLHLLDKVVLVIFIGEIVIKMGAQGNRPWRYFRDGWNVFDFSIVVVCLLPMEGQFAAVLRLVRILRVLRLISGVPRLQLLVGALLKSVPSMGYVGLLLLILFYVYGVMGVFVFGSHDPVHFGSLGGSMLSLFRIVTLEDWTDLMYTQIFGSNYVEGQTTDVQLTSHSWVAIAFFVTFILLGTMIMLNLFIGVIMNSMNEVQLEAQIAERDRHREKLGRVTLADDLARLEQQLNEVRDALHVVTVRARTQGGGPPDAVVREPGLS